MKHNKLFKSAPAVLLALVLSACGVSNPGFDASKASCTNIDSQIAKFNRSAVDHTNLANGEREKGTPDSKLDLDQAKEDTNNSKALQDRKKQCGVVPATNVDKTKANKLVVTAGLKNAGFREGDFSVDQPVDHKMAATATTGPGRFSASGYVDTAPKAVAFLASGTPAANAALAAQEQMNHATRAEILDATNWVVVQFNRDVQWNGNASFHGTVTATNSSRVDQAGTVGVFFVPPQQVAAGTVTSLGVLRGACGNPQFFMPTPPTAPTPNPTTTTPSTHNPATTPPSHECTLKPSPGYAVTPQCTLYKPPQTRDCMLNGGPNCPPNGGVQPVQEHPAGPTSGAGSRPTPNPVGPRPNPYSPAPTPNSGGYDSGASNGSGTPGGSTCDSSGCTTGPTPGPSQTPVDTGQGGVNSSPVPGPG